jgi:hypothetical protein
MHAKTRCQIAELSSLVFVGEPHNPPTVRHIRSLEAAPSVAGSDASARTSHKAFGARVGFLGANSRSSGGVKCTISAWSLKRSARDRAWRRITRVVHDADDVPGLRLP